MEEPTKPNPLFKGYISCKNAPICFWQALYSKNLPVSGVLLCFSWGPKCLGNYFIGGAQPLLPFAIAADISWMTDYGIQVAMNYAQ